MHLGLCRNDLAVEVINLSLLGTQTGSLALDSGANLSEFRLNNLTILPGAGAFSLGDRAGAFNFRLGGLTAATHVLANNSSNTAVINTDLAFLVNAG